MTISTHVLDTARGEPGVGVPVRLDRDRDGEWSAVAYGTTDRDGRVRELVPAVHVGTYRLVFDVDGPFFPEVMVVFRVSQPERHLHVPLLIGPYGYTTYRGT